MSKRQKQVVPYLELLAKVQGLLIGQYDCRNIHIDGIEVYREQIDGANWRVVRHRHSGSDNDWPACWEKIVPDIRLLRECYDVDENSPRTP